MTNLINDIGSNGITVTIPGSQTLISGVEMDPIAIVPAGGSSPYSYDEYLGILPLGLDLVVDGNSGIITGTPILVYNPFSIKFKVVDNVSGAILTDYLPFNVSDILNVSETTNSGTPIHTTVSGNFSYQSFTSGGRLPFSWHISSGELPSGILMGDNGIFSGSPSGVEIQNIKLGVVDADAQSGNSTAIQFIANPPVTVSQGDIDFIAETGNIFSVIAAGGSEPIFFESSGTLPSGVILVQDGVRTALIEGNIPVGTSSEAIRIIVTDVNGSTNNTNEFNISVLMAPPP